MDFMMSALEAAGERCAGGALLPERLPSEEYRQIEHHADHRSPNRWEGCDEAKFTPRRLDQRRTRQDEKERRQEGKERAYGGTGKSGNQRVVLG